MDISPLLGLRLRTPRLELRLPRREEIMALREVALEGIHPPEFMPFSIAWTDDPELADFLDYHEMHRRDWRPESWHLELAVFRDGDPIGAQNLMGEDFAQTRTVGTGSWLGRRFQGRGVGTEMRTAVLELAFRGLGAEQARSGAVDGNVASLRVSEKLGYRVVGHGTVAPRGVEIRHADVELRREDWQPPVAVEIAGLEPCLPLFGLPPE
ncbi:MAG TPA: GNAT family N-acetyltransferase [Gaiellaceae bacterium]|nr:GNAT family N-acetyltransferase [Gaiellaceae bacterium]